ncbi:hypothetical protein PoMZ_02432 [Pyricularia oryzae]|uniref:Uncharacterized protein n=2 Tax=Pyricularia TaxID=48558 RepID=Q8J180_PYRGI|nr:hypothetical protein [Pyricularia grisea]QBZ57506.1 hypothetical protein PoMZ_02432 [Pyricularia oryzae]
MKVQATFATLIALAAYFPAANAWKDCIIQRYKDGDVNNIYTANRNEEITIEEYKVFVNEACHPYPVILPDRSVLSGDFTSAYADDDESC